MSAFLVSKEHIDAICTLIAVSPYNNHGVDGKNLTEIGQILWDENLRSVSYRYRENSVGEKYVFKRNTQSPTQVLKLIDSLEYQSCETNDWCTTEAAKLLAQIKSIAISMLPGYDDLKWTL